MIGAAVGALPGGAAVLCLAHDCLVDNPGETEGFARVDVDTNMLLSAASALIALRRSIRAAAARGGGCGAGTSPGKAGADDRSEPLSEQSLSGAMESPHQPPATMAAIAQMEVAVELGVYGDALCADLAAISTNPSDPCLLPGGGSSKPPAQRSRRCCRTWRIRRAVEKHSALLSPQTALALAALLSAKAEAWASDISHDADSVPNADRSGHGRWPGEGEGSSPADDPAAWKVALSDALLAVRTASLEHLALWASACDPGRLDAACVADVLAEVEPSPSSPPLSSSVEVDAIATAVAAVAGVSDEGEEEDGGGSGGTEAIWAALHKASGVGFSPLMLLAATLSEDDADADADDYSSSGHVSVPSLRPSRPPSVLRGAGNDSTDIDSVENGSGDRDGSNDDDNGGGRGTADRRGGSGEVRTLVVFTKSTTRSALRLLSPPSLENVAQWLSRTRIQPDGNEGEASASAAQGGEVAANAGDQLDSAAGSSGSHEILDGVPGHPAIGDLSCLDDDTLKRGAEGVVGALDARCAGELPPAVLGVALQSGEAGFRLEPLQAQMVLQLAGGCLCPCCLTVFLTLDMPSLPDMAVRTFLRTDSPRSA